MSEMTVVGNDLQITGVEELYAALRGFPRKVRGKILRRTLREVNRVLLPECKSRAPKRKGNLAKAHKIRSASRRKGWIGVEVRVGGSGFFRNSTFYGGFLHFGWRVGPRRPPKLGSRLARRLFGDRRREIEPRPWMDEAFQAKAPSMQSRLPQLFWDEVKSYCDEVAKGPVKS